MPNSKQIVYLSQSQYAELIANGTITVNGVTVTYDENDIYVTPQAEPVTDVRVDGTSVAANGVADIPVANNTLGLVKVLSTGQDGVRIKTEEGTGDKLIIASATNAEVKNGEYAFKPLVPACQNAAAFYGLAKAAGHDEKNSTEPLGTYTPEAKGAIQQMLGVSDLIATAENNLVASKAYKVGNVFTANGKLYKATAAIAADAAIIPAVEGEEIAGANCEETSVGEGFPHDVQVNGTSVVTDGVAEIPVLGAYSQPGLIQIGTDSGLMPSSLANGSIMINPASDSYVKAGNKQYFAITTTKQHQSVFYGLAKAAGDTTQSASDNAVGTYTDNAKASIKAMLGIQDGSTGTVDISGTTPTITAVENTRYVCGEVTSLDFTPAASGICIVRFTSGSTVTVLTIPSTVKFPEWFDPTSLETNTIYEICVTDGVYGAVMSWAL